MQYAIIQHNKTKYIVIQDVTKLFNNNVLQYIPILNIIIKYNTVYLDYFN